MPNSLALSRAEGFRHLFFASLRAKGSLTSRRRGNLDYFSRTFPPEAGRRNDVEYFLV